MAANLTTVTFSLASGNYTGSQTVTLSCAGATAIFYSTNGVVPTDTSGTAGPSTTKISATSGPVVVSTTEAIMAYSYVSADSPADGPIKAVAIGIVAPTAAGTVVLSATTSNVLQSLVTDSIQAGYASNPFTASQSENLLEALTQLRNSQ